MLLHLSNIISSFPSPAPQRKRIVKYLHESRARSFVWAKSVRQKAGSSGHSGSLGSSSPSSCSLLFCRKRILADFSDSCEWSDLILQWSKNTQITPTVQRLFFFYQHRCQIWGLVHEWKPRTFVETRSSVNDYSQGTFEKIWRAFWILFLVFRYSIKERIIGQVDLITVLYSFM